MRQLRVPEFSIIMWVIVCDLEWSIIGFIGSLNTLYSLVPVTLLSCKVIGFFNSQSGLSSAIATLFISHAIKSDVC
jgi:hypothetical protein